MVDAFSTQTPGLTAPAIDGFAIAPDDDADLAQTTRAIYVGTGGALYVVLASGAEVSLANVGDGTVLPLRVRRVLESSTAGDLVGLC
jgi:serine/threonine protein phosphatase PrpC